MFVLKLSERRLELAETGLRNSASIWKLKYLEYFPPSYQGLKIGAFSRNIEIPKVFVFVTS